MTAKKKTLERIFQNNRSELINLAYGMLGTLADARDIVQDAYLKRREVNPEQINDANSYLKTIVSRLCIDKFRSAKERREEYFGPWLPQPVADSEGKMPYSDIKLHEQLTVALLHILENLSPDQRAIYLLHDVFEYPFSEVAQLVGKKPATCRKAAQRARQKIKSNKPPEPVLNRESEQLVTKFIEALRSGDIDQLQELITDDAVMYSDGGGKATAAPKPVEGPDRVSKFLMSIAQKTADRVTVELSASLNFVRFKLGKSLNLTAL